VSVGIRSGQTWQSKAYQQQVIVIAATAEKVVFVYDSAFSGIFGGSNVQVYSREMFEEHFEFWEPHVDG
jgi:hypothetical protein